MMKTEIKGCPWCGGQPHHEVAKVHNCGEPYFSVRLGCKTCGVSMSAVSRDADYDAARAINQKRYAEGALLVPFADLVAKSVIESRLLPRWNTRAQSTPQPADARADQPLSES